MSYCNYTGEKLCGSLDFIILYSIDSTVLLLTRTEIIFKFVYILALKMTLIKSVGKMFMGCRKSATNTNVFSHVTLIIYSVKLEGPA